jgi:hypothetical protein
MFETVTLQATTETQPYISLFGAEANQPAPQAQVGALWTDHLVRLQEKLDQERSVRQPLAFLLGHQIFSLGRVDWSIIGR